MKRHDALIRVAEYDRFRRPTSIRIDVTAGCPIPVVRTIFGAPDKPTETVVNVSLVTESHPTLDPTRKYKDRCRLARRIADRLGIDEGCHVRVDAGPYATYYRVYEIREHDAPLVVHEEHLDRLGIDGEQTVRLSTTIPQETPEQVRERGGLAETLVDDQTCEGVLVTAPHGGAVERGTDAIASRTYDRLDDGGVRASLWLLQGYNPPEGSAVTAHRRWHVGGFDRAVDGYPGLATLTGRAFDLVVGVHRSGYEWIEVGGRIDASVRERVADELRTRAGREVRTDLDRLHLPGTNPRISTNFLSKGGDRGLHVECTPGTCDRHVEEAAAALAETIRRVLA
ncbi:hypothetical protein [Halopiger aswanensis]|uniref:Uncharacterized protein n=1 Tax=Halopiger aswanensis TaxID=148449 RepID=A0A3R7HUZ5_9EURY|nr:hypothetical protein [Halopiger aswanensis]RKD86239.1 hypothetical protein ATJ93_4656 [Halopiger aswanensis]